MNKLVWNDAKGKWIKRRLTPQQIERRKMVNMHSCAYSGMTEVISSVPLNLKGEEHTRKSAPLI